MVQKKTYFDHIL